MTNKFKDCINNNIEIYKEIVLSLYNNPELGNEEFESSKKLVEIIKKLGFECEYPYICPTGFKGSYQSSKQGPNIAFLCEYDALPDIGHGCGHNLIGVISIAAAYALKQVIDEIGGNIYIFGTPAEENFGGKVEMAQAKAFDNMDLALMIHPATVNQVGGRTNALVPIKFEFFGKNAHGCKPYEGKSALDAAVLTYSGISMLRQFCLPNTFIHGIIKEGGKAANVVPAYASMEYYFRNPKMSYVKELTKRAIEIAEGAAMQAGVKMEHSVYECPYDDKLINYTLAKKLKEIYGDLNLENILDVNETPAGSSDIGAISYICPTLEGQIKIAEKTCLAHSKEMAQATISEQGTLAIINGGIALAMLAYDYITDHNFQEEVKKEFKSQI